MPTTDKTITALLRAWQAIREVVRVMSELISRAQFGAALDDLRGSSSQAAARHRDGVHLPQQRPTPLLIPTIRRLPRRTPG